MPRTAPVADYFLSTKQEHTMHALTPRLVSAPHTVALDTTLGHQMAFALNIVRSGEASPEHIAGVMKGVFQSSADHCLEISRADERWLKRSPDGFSGRLAY